MRGGVTPVIATVLLLIIAVAIAGGVFFWISTIQSQTQKGVESQTAVTTSRTGASIRMLGLVINTQEDYLNATIHNNGDNVIPSGGVVYTITDDQHRAVKSIVSPINFNIGTGEFITLNATLGGGLTANKTYTLKITFSDGTIAVGDTVARSFSSQSCVIADSCDDLNVCTSNLCVDYLCSYQFLSNGPVTGCTGNTGCATPPCGCVNGICNNYCTLTSECADVNPCTTDSCTGNTCLNTIVSDGQYTGCTGTTGCSGGVCACISGTCTNTCGNSICQAPFENYVVCPADCPASCVDEQGSCAGVYFTGTITTESESYCACCGDDAGEYFYNGSIGITNHICYNSALVNGVDNSQEACAYYGYNWINPAASWTETRPAGDADRSWRTLSMSADGAKIIAGDGNGRLWLSSDSGSSWTETRPISDHDFSWSASSMSADGSKIALAGIFGMYGAIYLSSNGGSSWSELVVSGIAQDWRDSAMSADGSKIIFCAYIGPMYYSSDSGSSWTELTPAGPGIKNWLTTSMSSDGTKIIAGSEGRLWLSSNSGSSWTETRPLDEDLDKTWKVSGMSGDGSKIIAGVDNGRLYISSNSGTSWTETRPSGDENKLWSAVGISADGLTILAGITAGELYKSIDGGATWSLAGAPLNNNYWAAFGINNDSSLIIAGNGMSSGGYGRLYISSLDLSSYTSCCGDDSTNDDFYNSTLETTSYFCINGNYLRITLDSNKTLCESYGNKWVNNVNKVVSFSSQLAGEYPIGISLHPLGEDHEFITESIVDTHQGRFKVLEVSVTADVDTGNEVLTLSDYPMLTSGSASFDFWINLKKISTNSYGDKAEFSIMIANLDEMFSTGNMIGLSFKNDSAPVFSFRNGPGDEDLTNLGAFNSNVWYNFRLDINRDMNTVKLYRDGVLLTTKSFTSTNPIDTIFIVMDRGSAGDAVYLDRIFFNWSTGSNACCGDDSNELFGNRTHYCSADLITPYTGAWYSGCSLGIELVNWDGVSEFSRNDTLSCDCSVNSDINKVSNPSFDTLDSWSYGLLYGAGDGYHQLNNTNVKPGSSPYSLYLESTVPDLGSQYYARQTIVGYSDPFEFSFYSLNQTAGSFSGIHITEPSGKSLYYVLFENGLTAYGYCNGINPGDPNNYIKCFSEFEELAWNTASVNIASDFQLRFGVDVTDITVSLFVGGSTYIYFDDIGVYTSTNGMYCDKDNNLGLADGICYQGSCNDVYLGGFSSTEFLNSEDILVNISLTNFTRTTCNLNFDGINYGLMTINNGYAHKSINSYPTGSYTAIVTCDGLADSASKTGTFTTDFIKTYKEVHFTDFTSSDVGASFPVIGEYNASNPGKEIAYAYAIRGSGSDVSLLVFSSDLKLLNNYSYHDTSDYVGFQPLRIVDTNNDSLNELIFSPNGNSVRPTIFSNDFTPQYTTTENVDVYGGTLAVANTALNNGTEIIATACGSLSVFDRTFTRIYNYQPGGGSCESRSFERWGPVAADIIEGGSHLEMLLPSTSSDRLHLLNTTHIIYQSENLSLQNLSSPVVAEFNSTYDGREIVIFNGNTLYALNSTLHTIWNYNFTGYNAYEPGSLAIGDVTGDGIPEIITTYSVPYQVGDRYPRKLTIFDNHGTKLITDLDTESNSVITLSELTSTNPGLEILMLSQSNNLQIINSTGNILYQGDGFFYVTDDIDNDGLIEIISTTRYGLIMYKTISTATTKVWPTFHANNENTGYLG